jgi:hypothetical protein
MNVLDFHDEILNVFKGQVASFSPRLVAVRADGKGLPLDGITGMT